MRARDKPVGGAMLGGPGTGLRLGWAERGRPVEGLGHAEQAMRGQAGPRLAAWAVLDSDSPGAGRGGRGGAGRVCRRAREKGQAARDRPGKGQGGEAVTGRAGNLEANGKGPAEESTGRGGEVRGGQHSGEFIHQAQYSVGA